MQDKIRESVTQAVKAAEALLTPQAVEFMSMVSQEIAQIFKQGNKVLIAGNGGSLCDANHFAEELTGQFRHKRAALPAIALSESGHMSCVANDFGFDQVFARGVEAFGNQGDMFIGLSTSGNSANIIEAMRVAKEKGLKTALFLGKGGGKLKGSADFELCIDGFPYSDRVQEAHMTAMHIIVEMIEEELFGPLSIQLSGIESTNQVLKAALAKPY